MVSITMKILPKNKASCWFEEATKMAINFESLKHEALPLARNDDMGATDIIRVSLLVGVRFVANLLCREEAA
jgi:hypothetical protein